MVVVIIILLYVLLLFWEYWPLIKKKNIKELWIGAAFYLVSLTLLISHSAGADLPFFTKWIVDFFDRLR